MRKVELTLYDLAARYMGIMELAGEPDHPLIQWWLSLCGYDLDTPDEVPWCSAFLNGMCRDLGLPMTKSAAARSWIRAGVAIDKIDAIPNAFDIAIVNRANGSMDPTIAGPAHVGIFAGWYGRMAMLLGGNQGNQVSVRSFDEFKIMQMRRLYV